MLADNFVHNYYGNTKDHRLTTAAICCFVFAFIHLLYRFFPSEQPKKVKPPSCDDVVSLPDKMFKHDDEAFTKQLVEMSSLRRLRLRWVNLAVLAVCTAGQFVSCYF